MPLDPFHNARMGDDARKNELINLRFNRAFDYIEQLLAAVTNEEVQQESGQLFSLAGINNYYTLLANFSSHIDSTSNPHRVSAAQVGADTPQWNADELLGYPITLDEEGYLRYDGESIVSGGSGAVASASFVMDFIQQGVELVIPENYQMIVHGPLRVHGTLRVRGKLVIL